MVTLLLTVRSTYYLLFPIQAFWMYMFPDSMTMLGQRWHRVVRWPMVGVGSTKLAQHCSYVNIPSLAVGSILVGINTLAQRWANVHRWRVLTWLDCVGCITLGQHWTNVCLPLWFWITVCWKYYVDPTLGQCSPVTCFDMLSCVGSITLGQHWTNVCMPLWFWMTFCWEYYVDPTSDQCTPVTCFNMTELRWLHNVGPTLDQSMHATLVFDDSLLRILRWSNVGPMFTGDLF